MISPQSIEMNRFLEIWHGPPNLEPIQAPLELLWLPPALQSWHSLESRWNKDLSRTLYIDYPWLEQVEEGRAVFMRDQGSWEIAFLADSPDTLVESSRGGEWTPIEKTLSEALIHAAVLEATLSAPFRVESRDMPPEGVESITSRLEEIDFTPWKFPGSGKTFMGDGILVLVKDLTHALVASRRRPGRFALQAVAMNQGNLAHAEDVCRSFGGQNLTS